MSPLVSLIVPTYREVESLPHLLPHIERLRAEQELDLELLIVDDDSQDGTRELVSSWQLPWVQFIERKADRGLSQSVLEGMAQAKGDVLVVMDADLSHPPEAIPQMLGAIAQGADFVLGSRYIEGGTTDDSWGPLRWLNSKVATWLAMPLTRVSDPMSGFFAIPRSSFARAQDPSPLGYKIGLELLVRCRCTRVVEVPIHFSNRIHGESKLTLHQQLLYLRHLGRLYRFKFSR